MLTNERAREDYVKAIYQLGAGAPIASAVLARYLRVSRAAVSKFRRVLAKDGLIKPSTGRTDPIQLTARGHALATKMIRRHRLVETFLHQMLHVPLDVLHAQAEAIEHVISDDVAARLDRFLGNPHADPHGHPIADIDRAARPARIALAQAGTGSRVRVEEIPDHDPAVVRHLAGQRVLPGLTARVVDRDSRNIKLRSERGTHVVSLPVAATIDVSMRKRGERG